MTVTLVLSTGESVTVSNVTTSEIVNDLISYTGNQDVVITIPKQYNTAVVNVYTDFLHNNNVSIANVKILLQCFYLESFMVDNMFFIYLMSQAYKIWDEFYPCVNNTPNDRLVYLYCPYEFIPSKYMDDPHFYKEWLQINKNKIVTLVRKSFDVVTSLTSNYNEEYYTDVKYHNNGQMMSFDVYHLVDDKIVGGKLLKTWYNNGSIKIIETTFIETTFIDKTDKHKWKQTQEMWFKNGGRAHIYNFVDGKQHGIQEIWYSDGRHETYTRNSTTGENYFV